MVRRGLEVAAAVLEICMQHYSCQSGGWQRPLPAQRHFAHLQTANGGSKPDNEVPPLELQFLLTHSCLDWQLRLCTVVKRVPVLKVTL